MKLSFSEKYAAIFSAAALVGLVVIFGFVARKNRSNSPKPTFADTNSHTTTAPSPLPDARADCPSGVYNDIVRGISLEPLVHGGATVRISKGYYDCHAVQRGDLIIYHYVGNEYPLIKIVKAIPDDAFALQKNPEGLWNIVVNGGVVKNSEGVPYALTERKSAMLKLYAKDYPRLPVGTYLILGNLANGSTDSTAFGLVGTEGIIGKAEVVR